VSDGSTGRPATAPGEALRGRVARIGLESDRVTEEIEVDVLFVPPLQDHLCDDVFLLQRGPCNDPFCNRICSTFWKAMQ